MVELGNALASASIDCFFCSFVFTLTPNEYRWLAVLLCIEKDMANIIRLFYLVNPGHLIERIFVVVSGFISKKRKLRFPVA